jgi:hypothetical protein
LGRGILRGVPAHDHEEEHMGETITMAEVLYVPVDDQGEPYRWGPENEVTVSAFGDFWGARRSPEGKGRVIRALALDDLQELLRGRWSDVTEVAYHPAATGYIKTRDDVLGMVIEGLTDQ